MVSLDVLYGIFMTDGPENRVTMRAYRRTLFERDRWVHIAWVWGPRRTPGFTTGKPATVFTARLYVDGKAGQQFC